MKKVFVCAVMVVSSLLSSVSAEAQSPLKVQRAQVASYVAAGNFNNGGDTAQKTWTVPVLYTASDSVVLAASAGDSASIRLVGNVNSVTLQANVTILSGTSCDSVKVNFWGSSAYGNGTGAGSGPVAGTADFNTKGAYVLLQSNTLGSGTYAQAFQYTSAYGNPETNYRITVDVADLAGTCIAVWRGYALVR